MFERSYLQNIIVNAPIGIITTDMVLRVTFISEAAKTTIGRHPTTTSTAPNTPESQDTVVQPEFVTELTTDSSEIAAHLDPVLKQEKDKSTFELDIYTGRESRIVRFTCSMLRDDYYVPIGLLLMCEDVTEQRETDRKYRNFIENSIDAVFIFKRDVIVEVNPAFSNLAGKEPQPSVHLKWKDFIHPDSLEQVLDYALRRDRGDTDVPNKFDCYGFGADGAKLFWNISVSPIYPRLGVYSALIHDLTEQKVLQQRLIHTRKMETVSLLAGGIAHDFNNLLTGVLGYSSLIKSVLDLNNPIYDFVNSIESSALQAKELNDQLVAFARLGKYTVKPISLNKIIGRTLRLLQLTFDKRIRINTVFTKELKEIEANDTQIQQVITNICINSSEAMPEGGTLTVKANNMCLDLEKSMGEWSIPPGDYIHLSISDTGCGFRDDMLDKVFEPFLSTKGLGYGLGLAAAYGIIKNHKGYITARNLTGKGAVIDVYFPAALRKIEHKKKTISSIPKDKGRVLVVDDEDVVREILADILRELGYKPLTAEDAEHAIDVYSNEWKSIDVIFLDMIMPGMNGEEAFEELKKINPDIKVIVCTGYTDEDTIQKMMEKGAVAVIRKPFRMDDISAVMGEALAASGRSGKSG